MPPRKHKPAPSMSSPCRKYVRSLEYWRRLLPENTARKQAGWERHQSILRGLKAGASSKIIAAHTGLSYRYILKMKSKAERKAESSPVEFFCGLVEPSSRFLLEDLKQVARMIRHAKLREVRANATP